MYIIVFLRERGMITLIRFELTSRGWYRPKIGHDAEMRYRAEMREKNEMTMITLRAKKRRENHLKKI